MVRLSNGCWIPDKIVRISNGRHLVLTIRKPDKFVRISNGQTSLDRFIYKIVIKSIFFYIKRSSLVNILTIWNPVRFSNGTHHLKTGPVFKWPTIQNPDTNLSGIRMSGIRMFTVPYIFRASHFQILVCTENYKYVPYFYPVFMSKLE